MFIAIFTFIGGFYVRKFFDNRDLRRKILEPSFEKFEEVVVYLQNEWRRIQAANINHEKFDDYANTCNEAKDRLIKSRTDIVFACKKIREKELITLVEKAFKTLTEAMSDYSFFMEYRGSNAVDREELSRILREANNKFDKTFTVAMEDVYSRYWVLITGVFISSKLDDFFPAAKSLYKKIF